MSHAPPNRALPWLEPGQAFPPVETAWGPSDPAPGLLAAGGVLDVPSLIAAYSRGIFPWFSAGQPILWWSTDPRMVLYTDRFIVSDSLRKKLKKVARSMAGDKQWEIRFDSAFRQVLLACAAPRRDGAGTWISDDIMQGYTGLHRLGHAHSAELWQDGKLVAGAYGVCIGRMFYGESMFTNVSDGSKIALAWLVAFLREQGVAMIDCQQETGHLASLGAAPISRDKFIAHLEQAIHQPPIEIWEPARHI